MKNEHTQAINAITAEMEDILKFGKRAENTISTYKTYAVPYLEYCFDTLGKSPCESSEKDVRSFLSCIQADRDLDDRTINNAISSIHFLFVSVLNLPWNKYKVPFLTFDEYVPFVPTKEEMEAFLSAVPDPKRKAMFIIMYATGLRVSEVCTLRYGDIIKSKRRIHVAPSKRRKERFVEMPQACIDAIIQYAGTLRPEVRRSLGFSRNSIPWMPRSIRTLSLTIYLPLRSFSAGSTASPAIPSAEHSQPITIWTLT